MLADDHPTVLRKVAHLLNGGYEIVARVSDGRALVEAAARLKPDVLVTDISMPVMNGIEALQRLKGEGIEVKTVFLTVHDDTDVIRAALNEGALGYVTKSRMAKDLIPAIKEALAGHRFLSPSVAANLPEDA